MPRDYSVDLRHRITACISGGLSCRGAAQRFAVSPSTAICYQQRLRCTGCLAPDRRRRLPGGGKLGLRRKRIIAKVEEQPDITMPALASFLFEKTAASVTPSNLSKLLCKA